MNGERLHSEWFRKASESFSPPEWPSTPPISRPAGDPVWSTLGGTFAGAIGAAVVLVILRRIDLREEAGIGAVGLAVGACLGAAFGRLTRRLVPVIPRIALGAIFASAAWLALYAFVMLRFLPRLAASIPFTSSIRDACAFGACLGLLPPLRVRNERGRRP